MPPNPGTLPPSLPTAPSAFLKRGGDPPPPAAGGGELGVLGTPEGVGEPAGLAAGTGGPVGDGVAVGVATGAGDAFVAALTFCRMKDYEIEEAVRFSMAASILALSHEETINPNISEEKVFQKMKEAGLC